MPIKEIAGGGTIVTGEAIGFVRLIALRAALRLEMLGMKRGGRPASVIVREAIGSKTKNKQKLLEELNAFIKDNEDMAQR